MWPAFLSWLRDNQIGDLTGLAGLVLSLVGFAATLVGVFRSKAAAERAEQAARAARDSIRLFETVVDVTSAIAMLEDIKRGHRQEQWELLLDRYAAIRKVLVTLSVGRFGLTEGQLEAIQSALSNVSTIERAVKKGLTNPKMLKAERFNRIVSRDIEKLLTVLLEIKIAQMGDRP